MRSHERGRQPLRPGNRANATIGRAVRLIILNVFRMAPGIADKSTQGHPGKYCSCIAERADVNPWPSLRDELGYPDGVSSVTVYAAAGFVNVENHGGNRPEQILDSVADAMANYGSISIGQSVVVLSPEHARIVAGAGWSKADVQDYLFAQAVRPLAGMQRVGKYVERERALQGGAGGDAPRLDRAGHPGHGGRRRRRRPFRVHPLVEPIAGVHHAVEANWRVP